jgi:putative endonuclease
MVYVYILKCSDGSLYTGWTNDLEKRLVAHNAGTASKCTRARRPVELVYSEIVESKSDALKREAAIKRLTREQKLKLIIGRDPESSSG